MKKIFTALCMACTIMLLISTISYAQSKIISSKTKITLKTNRVVSYALFTRSEERDETVDAAISNVVYLKLDRQKLNELYKSSPAAVSFDLPLNGASKTIVLGRTDIFSEDFVAQVKDESGSYLPVAKPTGIFYHGYESSDDYSLAAVSFFADEAGGIISIPGEEGNYNLTLNRQNPGPDKENYLLFKEGDVKNAASIFPVCAGARSPHDAAIKNQVKNKAAANENGLSCKTVSLALYGDYKLFQKNSNSVAGTQNYLTVLFNGLAALYENDGIRLALKQLNVHTANDNYPTSSSSDVLSKFGNEIQTNTTADFMQLVTGYTSSGHPPLGGVAWLDMLCANPYYFDYWDTYIGPFSIINTVGNPNLPLVPVYSWDVNCSAHELGHNLGSPHTHDCAWNGNNTAIDGCGPTADIDYEDSNCPIGPIPATTVKGTIMSYCHLLSGVGVNFANGFGPQPAALIRSRIATAGCLSDEYMPTAVLSHADSVVYANAFCKAGNKLYCYDNRNDFNRGNDRLVLIITNNNIATLDLSNVEISMTTNGNYNSNTAVNAVSYNYLNGLYDAWYQANRSWKIKLNQTLPGETTYNFPFLQQDMNDLNGSLPGYGSVKDSIKLVVYKTNAAASQPALAPAGDVKIYNNGLSNGDWNYTSNWTYKLATIKTNAPVSGATLAVGKEQAPAGIPAAAQQAGIKIFPNPVTDKLYISYASGNGLIQKIELIDYLGSVVRASVNQSGEQVFEVGNLAAGVYLIRCVTDRGAVVSRFVKE